MNDGGNWDQSKRKWAMRETLWVLVVHISKKHYISDETQFELFRDIYDGLICLQLSSGIPLTLLLSGTRSQGACTL